MEIEGLITDLAFILLLGAFVTVLFKWIRQPVVLGYIVAGFLASPHFAYLPAVPTDATIDCRAESGIVVLLFSLGLEFSFKKLLNSGGSAVVTALIIVVGMMLAGFAIGHILGFNTINSLFLGGMLSMSSTTIIIKAFTDLGLRQRKFASMVLAVLIVEDLFAVVMMVILSSIAINNSVEGSQLLLSVGKLVFFLVMWFIVGVYVLPSMLNAFRRFLNSETLLVISMGLCLGMSVFSVYCGFSLALGSFVMGSILAGTSYAERIEHVVTPVKDLFGSVFFISVGMMVQPAILVEYWLPILILSAVVITGMIIFGTFGMLVTGQTLKVAIESGFSLTQIGEFAFIIATLGMSLGVLVPTLYPIVVAVSVITTFTTPYFIKMAVPVYNAIERHLPARLRFLIDRYQNEASKDAASGHKWGKVIRRFAGTTIIYSIILTAIMLASKTYLAPWLDSLFPDWSRMLGAAVTLCCMAPFLLALVSPPSSDSIASTPGARIPCIVILVFRWIIAFIFVIQVLSRAYSAWTGIYVAVAILLLAALYFSKRLRGQMSRMETKFIDNLNERELRRSGRNNQVVSDLHQAYMTVGSGCAFAGQTLADSNLRHRFGVNVVSIQRGPRLISIPGARQRLYPGDVIGVIGTDEQLQRMLPEVEVSLPEGQSDGEVRLASVLLDESSPLAGATPRSSSLRSSYDAIVVAVQREGEYIDSDPDLIFRSGDLVWLVGDPKKIAGLKFKQEKPYKS
ncbi:MAG: cation:proton antiporter [Muribaculaceae bacterium]|nr:cation:proton antiporter [Muribaculaceae bacterium]